MATKFLTVLGALLLLIGFDAKAQGPGHTPAASHLPWNTYYAERIPDDFQSIVGSEGTTLIPGSQNARGALSSYGLNLPFNFRFLGQPYSAGFEIAVAIQGYISFNNALRKDIGWNYPEVSFSAQTTLPYYNKIVAPYWSDLQAEGLANAGIYWKVEGEAPTRVLIIEWRVQGAFYEPGFPGNFQCRLYEEGSVIEFHYGPNSIDRRVPAPDLYGLSYGALVGIKNLGQAAGVPQGDDSEKFLMMLHPDQVVNDWQPGRDTAAITRTRTGIYFGYTDAWAQNWVESNAYAPSYIFEPFTIYTPSPFWHYSFPTMNGQRVGYRIRPILRDIKPEVITFLPERTANAYNQNATVSVQVTLLNPAPLPCNETVSITAQVYRDADFTTPVAVLTGSVDGVGPEGARQNVLLTPVLQSSTPPVTNRPGHYTVRVHATFSGDQDPTNDTLQKVFYIAAQDDIAVQEILQPIEPVPPLNYRYPAGVPVPIEARFWNVGTALQQDVPVGYEIVDAGGNTVATGEGAVPGVWGPIGYRDVNLPSWTPTTPGRYYIRVFPLLEDDENRLNDTVPGYTTSLGRLFDVRYDIEVEAVAAGLAPHIPLKGAAYPDGKPIYIEVPLRNNGMSDATDVPVQVTITDKDGNVVYDKTKRVLNLNGESALAVEEFPEFTPDGSGEYCVSVTAQYPQDPVQTNDRASWCFNVARRLAGTIHVGTGERFRTIREARDSMLYYGVEGNVDFVLVDDEYVVEPQSNDPSLPALDMRGSVVGAGPNARVTWKPAPGKTDIHIRLRTPSGYGIQYGQTVDREENASGYVTWDGGPNKAFRFTLEQTNEGTNRAAVFYFGPGSHDYGVRNCRMAPATIADGRKEALHLDIPRFNQTFNQFTFRTDLQQEISAGIFQRNLAPFDPATGLNLGNADTLWNQNNVFAGNEIRDFGYGIVSIGIGPLFVVGQNRYVEYHNRNNTYSGNRIRNVTRAGIALAFEKEAAITDNRISDVVNNTNRPHAVGIWATAGGNGSGDRAYAMGLTIDRNMVSNIEASSGAGAGIWVETAENQLVSPSNEVVRLPQGGRTDLGIRNNMIWNYMGQEQSAAVALTVEPSIRPSFRTHGNSIEHSTVFNPQNGAGADYGLNIIRADVAIHNNIIALTGSGDAVGLRVQAIDREESLHSDYNIFWVPNGAVGALQNLSTEGYRIPSPPIAQTLSQWRYLTGYDDHSATADITRDFVSTSEGSEDLHINPMVVGSPANNRGMVLTGVAGDIDGHPRGSAAAAGRYDIGADEFTGNVTNNDLMAEDVIAPFGYRGSTGPFSDAEYVMTGPDVNLVGRVRNLGGQPNFAVDATLEISYWNGTAWVAPKNWTLTARVDVTETGAVDFGSFQPKTLKDLGVSDGYFGSDPNVTPIYRLRLVTGTDDNAGNNSFEKLVRFYVQRSGRKVLASVENYVAEMPDDVIELGNKLNADTLVAAFDRMHWDRADNVGTEDYDLFDRARWPQEALNFTPWKTMVWMQGDEAEGLTPWERSALKDQLDHRSLNDKAGLFIMGQEIARKHDVALTAENGQIADREFVRTYLRSEFRGSTSPELYDNRRIQGSNLTTDRLEVIAATGVEEDLGPMPSTLRATLGPGIAGASYDYLDQVLLRPDIDTVAGMTAVEHTRSVVYNAWDIRHTGVLEMERWSGAARVVLAAIDFLDQYGGVLPVEVLSFDAYQTGREAVTIDWATATEVDVAAMEIERSCVATTATGEELTAGVVVNRVTPQGSAAGGAEYRIVDRSVKPGLLYEYRLVSVGLDGSRTVERGTRVKVDESEQGLDLSVVPNPLADRAVIRFSVPGGDIVRVSVYDEKGGVVMVREVRGEGSVEFDARALPSGVYTVGAEFGSGVELKEKVVVKH